jgi:predicted RNase H-like HicB family nuclease
MLKQYIQIAMERAQYEILEDDGSFYGEIPGFQGVLSNELALEACRDELQEVLEDWILFRLGRQLPLPVVHHIDLNAREIA